MNDRTAVMLLQMGGPDSLDAVEPFLRNLFSDRDIISIGPRFLQPVIARFIAKRRAPRVMLNYAEIGGKSPLRELTERQALALQESLGDRYHCVVAMRYWHPFTHEALACVRREGITRIIALSLYPHYSRATTGSSINELRRVIGESSGGFSLSIIDHFHDHPRYIDALEEKIREGLELLHPLAEREILFSAHSLPQSFIDEGDPYLDQIRETVRLVMERFPDEKSHLAFQSRAGPVKWLEPSTDEKLKEIAATGLKNLLIVPLSFVSDHIETLYEIDREYGKLCYELGFGKVARSPSLNDSPAFISCLADLVRSHDT